MCRLVCVLLVLLTTMSALSQEKSNDIKMQISGGVKIESNITQYMVIPQEIFRGCCNVGASAGGFVRIDLVKNFAVQGELLAHYKSSIVESDSRDYVEYWGLEIPVYAMYNLHIDKGHWVSFGLGPYCEFGLYAMIWEAEGGRNLYDTELKGEIQAMDESNSGFGALIGYETPFGLQVNVSFKMSITNILDANSNKAAMYPMAASVGVAYRWGR